MRKAIWICTVLLIACNSKKQDLHKADDALDAGREYIAACMQGDFSKAAFYALPDDKNNRVLSDLEKIYREKDKEGRQQLRNASINISEVKELPDSSTEIHYNFSNDTSRRVLLVVKRDGDWKVDASKH
jgi:hypothetical protein